jgi:uncharacterized membrane protein
MLETRKGIKGKIAFTLAFVAGIIILITASLQVVSMLADLGFYDIFSEIKGKISNEATVQLSLYLTFPILGVVFALWGGFLILKGSTRRGGILSIGGIILSLVSLSIPQNFGFGLRLESIVGTALAIVLVAVQSFIGFTTPQIKVKKGPILTSSEVATVAVFSAMTAVITAMTGQLMPSPTGGYTHIGDAVIFMAALLFGYKAGALAGIIGCVIADFYGGYPRWYVSIPAHGIEGALPGLAKGKHIAIQVLLCVLGGFIMATVYFYVNIFIKGYPVAIISYARDLFGQVGVSMVIAVVLTRIVQRMLPQLKK